MNPPNQHRAWPHLSQSPSSAYTSFSATARREMPLSHCRTFTHVSHLTGNIEAPFNSTRVAETRQKRGRNAAETRQSNHRPCLARLLYRWRASLACFIAGAPRSLAPSLPLLTAALSSPRWRQRCSGRGEPHSSGSVAAPRPCAPAHALRCARR
jgi:hypothetical protein